MAYLFVHFTGEDENGEQIYFSVSKDGLHWMDLGSGPALVSDIGEKGVRDPFLVRNCLNGKFYLMATDLRIANQKGWNTAQYNGSLNLILWESDTLTGWAVRMPWIFPKSENCRAAVSGLRKLFSTEQRRPILYIGLPW